MNKVVKGKIIKGICLIIIGIIFLICRNVYAERLNEENISYINGFITGIMGAGVFLTLQGIIAIVKPEKSKKMENEWNDERLWSLSNKAMSITFRFSVLVEAGVSIACALLNKMTIAVFISYVLIIQMIVYLITYFIINKKN